MLDVLIYRLRAVFPVCKVGYVTVSSCPSVMPVPLETGDAVVSPKPLVSVQTT